ncbi:hypothetical protein FB45DRAFT_1120438 [Roridomyces roridus]|uniref:Uncharacterized protein n=1 Tax=Roridomyces roridus TaxID=1738132 RepID=A0AAD7B5S6_9AGAR|nr:hypothetical protein FB45DRAFT_1120438 [Roridomyces roridus]
MDPAKRKVRPPLCVNLGFLSFLQVTVKVIEPPPQRNYANRSPSPYKPPSPTFRPRAKINSTANVVVRKATSTVSTSSVSRTIPAPKSTPTSSLRSLTPRSASPTKQLPRPRAGLTRGVTSKSAPVSALLNLSDDDSSPANSPRIISKLSGLARNELPPQSPTLLPTSSLRARTQRPRVPSISSNASSSSSPFYQASAQRQSPPSSGSVYQSFDPSPPKYTARVNLNGGARVVDPTTIPLPSQSPPMSTISFSSRSSLSGPGSSTGYVTESGTSQLSAPLPVNGHGRRTSIDVSSNNKASDSEDEPDEEDLRASTAERKVRAEAKSVRKIADLEITNRSLLAINTTLEQTRHRQAKELRELRRKLRESRLILPPRAFRAVKSSLDHDDTADEEDEEEEDAEAEAAEPKARMRMTRHITTTPRDFPEPSKVAKVLSAYEVQQLSDDPDEPLPVPASTSPRMFAVPDSSDSDGGASRTKSKQ